MMGLVNLLIYLLIFMIVFGLIYYVLERIPFPEPIKGWVFVVFVVLCGIVLIYFLLSFVGGGGNLKLLSLK